jgi:hypothetical protein
MDDVREQISQLEAQIEDHAEAIERCRKLILAAQAAIALGALLILGILIRVIRFDPVIMVCGLTAVMGGIVVLGSNRSTANQKTAAMKSAEALRAELIGRIDLRVVEDRP